MKKNTWSIILIVSIIIFIASMIILPYFFNDTSENPDDYYYHSMMWGNHMGYWMIVPMLIAIFVIYSGFQVFVSYSKKDDALNILKQRYVNGEISEDEYIQKKKILKDD